MDLFTIAQRQSGGASSPLAESLRPQDFADFFGQTEALGGSVNWRKLAQDGKLPSLILWGPPGTGKTTFALLLAREAKAEVEILNAIEMGAKALRELGEKGRYRNLQFGTKTIAFIDEIHRLNKAQQDVLLPFLEKGDLILIGATTENPSFELNSALLSRSRLIVFHPLNNKDLKHILQRALVKQGIDENLLLSAEASDALLESVDGDARTLLNRLESLIENYRQNQNSNSNDFPLSIANLNSILGQRSLRYDQADSHYDHISAYIKSIRGSDANAGLYYLARMLKGGEDPLFIARRLVILASEDVGNADPRGLSIAVAAFQGTQAVGLPEAAILLAQATTYLASAPKSNASYMGLKEAQQEVEVSGALPIPLALRSAKTPSMLALGYGADYKYSHEGEKSFIPQHFLPEKIKQKEFYKPKEIGFEKTIRDFQAWLRNRPKS